MNWAFFLSAHGHGSVRPILQGSSGFILIVFSCPLHPFWSVIVEEEDQMGDGTNFYGLSVQSLGADGSNGQAYDNNYNELTA